MIEVRNNPIEMKNDTVFCNVQRAVFFIRNVKISPSLLRYKLKEK